MGGYECAVCGLAECDLPDGVDPEFVFERTRGVTHCQVCEPAEKVHFIEDLEDEAEW